MGNGRRITPFERVLNEVEGRYHNFDGGGYDDYELEYDYADGTEAEAEKVKLFQADPYQIIVSNSTDDALKAILFGNDKYLLSPNFGNPVGITISIGQPGVEYVELLQGSSTTPFATQFMRVESANSLQISKFITVHDKNANGNWFQRPINLQQFKSAYQQDKNMLDVPLTEEINGKTYWEVEIEAHTKVFFTIFPLYKVDTSGTLRGRQPIMNYAPAQVNTSGLAPVSQPLQGGRPKIKLPRLSDRI